MPSSVRAAHSHTGNIRRVSRNYPAIAGPDPAERGRWAIDHQRVWTMATSTTFEVRWGAGLGGAGW